MDVFFYYEVYRQKCSKTGLYPNQSVRGSEPKQAIPPPKLQFLTFLPLLSVLPLSTLSTLSVLPQPALQLLILQLSVLYLPIFITNEPLNSAL